MKFQVQVQSLSKLNTFDQSLVYYPLRDKQKGKVPLWQSCIEYAIPLILSSNVVSVAITVKGYCNNNTVVVSFIFDVTVE